MLQVTEYFVMKYGNHRFLSDRLKADIYIQKINNSSLVNWIAPENWF